VKVVFTAHAVSRLRQILAYIAADSAENAVAVVDRIIARAEALETLAFRGRRVPEYEEGNIREVSEPPYRIIYRVQANVVQVLTVMHERQLLPDELPRPEDR
jgi:plasmid stabilization system protein ParE